jgi:hypothetical protein
MTQDQTGQARDPGYARGEVIADEAEGFPDEQPKPMTRFQKVASALRGDSPERDDPDTAAREQPVQAEPVPDQGAPRHVVPASETAPGQGGTEAGYGSQAGTAEAGLRPGEATDRLGDFSDIAFGNLLADADQYTAQWQRIQFRFVDDPQGSVTAAADIVSQVTGKLEAAIQERQRAIDERQRAIQERARALRRRWGEGSQADTETLRETLRMYRVFMDQLIGPTA